MHVIGCVYCDGETLHDRTCPRYDATCVDRERRVLAAAIEWRKAPSAIGKLGAMDALRAAVDELIEDGNTPAAPGVPES